MSGMIMFRMHQISKIFQMFQKRQQMLLSSTYFALMNFMKVDLLILSNTRSLFSLIVIT